MGVRPLDKTKEKVAPTWHQYEYKFSGDAVLMQTPGEWSCPDGFSFPDGRKLIFQNAIGITITKPQDCISDHLDQRGAVRRRSREP